jgi:hypothetical protein
MKKLESLFFVWLLWAELTTLVGGLTTWAMVAFITQPNDDILAIILFSPPLMVLILLAVGATQALLLSMWLKKRHGRTLASAAGVFMAVPFFLWLLFFGEMFWQGTYLLAGGAVLVGAFVGFAQARLMGLRRHQRGQWMLATACCCGVVWALGFPGEVALLTFSPHTDLLNSLLTCGRVWLFLGLTTGSMLLILFHEEFHVDEQKPLRL